MSYLGRNRVHVGDVRELAGRLEPGSVQTIVTSPPYFGLRSYLPGEHDDKHRELGSEPTPAEFVANLVAVFRALRDCLKDDGTVWLNLGDSYAGNPGGAPGHNGVVGHGPKGFRDSQEMDGGRRATGYPNKCLLGMPWRVAFALIDDGWILRSDIVWSKPAPMPESVRDRPTRSHEYLFLLAKGPRYYYDAEAIAERSTHAGKTVSLGAKSLSKGQANGANIAASGNGLAEFVTVTETRNKRSVWTVNSAQFPDSHYATFPPDLIRPCVLAGTSERGECAACGRAWVRTVERTQGSVNRANYAAAEAGAVDRHRGLPERAGGFYDAASTTTGWAPQCACPPGTPTRPQVVLDPFLGSGTSAMVAHEEGRHWVGIDLDARAVGWTRDRLAKYPIGRLAGM